LVIESESVAISCNTVAQDNAGKSVTVSQESDYRVMPDNGQEHKPAMSANVRGM
jgi:hypothetical protein